MTPAGKPATPAELQDRILARYNELSARLRQIAHYVVDHPNDIALETTAVIAARANVQPSAIIRFAKAFGFSGFTELQRIYQNRLAETASSYSERLRRLGARDEDTGQPAVVDLLGRFSKVNALSLQHLEESLSAAHLEAAVARLASAASVYVCGLRRSFPVAAFSTYALGQVGAPVRLLDGAGGMLTQQARAMRADDVLFAVSFYPYAPETQAVIDQALAAGSGIVVVTDTPLSPVAERADVCLEVHDAELHHFRSLTASMCLAQVISVAVGLALQSARESTNTGTDTA